MKVKINGRVGVINNDLGHELLKRGVATMAADAEAPEADGTVLAIIDMLKRVEALEAARVEAAS